MQNSRTCDIVYNDSSTRQLMPDKNHDHKKNGESDGKYGNVYNGMTAMGQNISDGGFYNNTKHKQPV
jgi:hypothetical protein